MQFYLCNFETAFNLDYNYVCTNKRPILRFSESLERDLSNDVKNLDGA